MHDPTIISIVNVGFFVVADAVDADWDDATEDVVDGSTDLVCVTVDWGAGDDNVPGTGETTVGWLGGLDVVVVDTDVEVWLVLVEVDVVELELEDD